MRLAGHHLIALGLVCFCLPPFSSTVSRLQLRFRGEEDEEVGEEVGEDSVVEAVAVEAPAGTPAPPGNPGGSPTSKGALSYHNR